ncbi:MAG: ATP-binding protein [Planctomycetes bacterium]|nr:ATP-binding protein [Planctomycetota bacterium]
MAPRVAPPVPLHTAPPSGTDTVAILPGALPGSHQRSRRLMYVYRPNRHIRLPSTTPRRTGKVTCPHCWAVFPVEDTLFIARHQDLVGDAVLGPGERQRFLPSRLTPRGNALDAEGLECPDRTCPTCHLRLPRCLYERDSFFVSIVGAPGSGKSYLLTALTWELRRLLPKEYNFVLADADPETNQWLNAYEETLFLSGTPDRPVYLKKTELQGELYQQVVLNGMPVLLPRPAILTLRPQERHLRYPECGEGLARNVVLYDNAGEHFQPGRDTPGEPGTQHLVRSQAIFLVLDPLLDPRFATRCRAATGPTGAAPLRAQRQDLLLAELANRILRYRGSGAAGKVTLPLIVVLTKFDAWRHLLGWQPPEMPTRWSDSRNVSAVDLDTIVTVSLAARDLLLATCPEIVSQAEAFSQHVIYIPVSALGHAPAASPDGMYQVKPADIRAWWVTVPFLYLLSQIGFVPVLDRPARADDPPTARTQVEGDQIHVEVPGSAVHYLIPASHAGHVVRCPKTGSRFRIPSVDVAEAR